MNKPYYVYLGIGLLSAATLAFELVLTRLFALAQGYHFAFMAVTWRCWEQEPAALSWLFAHPPPRTETGGLCLAPVFAVCRSPPAICWSM